MSLFRAGIAVFFPPKPVDLVLDYEFQENDLDVVRLSDVVLFVFFTLSLNRLTVLHPAAF